MPSRVYTRTPLKYLLAESIAGRNDRCVNVLMHRLAAHDLSPLLRCEVDRAFSEDFVEALLHLKTDNPVPKLIRAPVRAAFSLPQRIRAHAQVLIQCSMPVDLSSPICATVFFPKSVSPFANLLLQTQLGFGILLKVVAIG
jgi:hypothetical protein